MRKRAPRHINDTRDLLGPGSQQVAAGYVLYGPATQLIYTSGAGVDMFTFDPQIAEFVLWKENLKMPQRGPYYSCNQGNITKWNPGAQNLVRHLTSRKDKTSSYSMRYCGAFVADFHRCLIDGGIYHVSGRDQHRRQEQRQAALDVRMRSPGHGRRAGGRSRFEWQRAYPRGGSERHSRS